MSEMNQGRILVVDDEKNIRTLISNEFSEEGFEIVTAASGEEGLALFQSQNFDVVLLDIKLPKQNGIAILKRMREVSPAAEIIMITGYGGIRSAVDCIKLGARDFITKPFNLDELLKLVQNSVREKAAGFSAGEEEQEPSQGSIDQFIRCSSPAMQKVYDVLDRIATSDCKVLIHGETGVGKDVLANEIHCRSRRRDGPYVCLDCGMLSENLAESELYGHRKGAFSGASGKKTGMVEKSHKGTLFLDEIGNIDLELQKKFLRFVETQRIRAVGETREKYVDTRIILATNLDPYEAARKGILRSDFYYRIAEVVLYVPPLRDRPQDILLLAEFYLNHFSNGKSLSTEAANILIGYSWPGNVRELKSLMTRISLMVEGPKVKTNDLPRYIANRPDDPPGKFKSLEDLEKEHILTILSETGGNQSQTAQILGINRKTLYKKIKKYNIFS